MKPLSQHHWFCIVPLLPALTMIAIHKAFGLSDQMMGRTAGQPPATDAEVLFNLVMGMAFYMGAALYLAHAIKLGREWLIIKLGVLAVVWYLVLLWLEFG